MYLRKVHIENIRSITELDWEIPAGQEAGWHVVIGDNGSGKSTFLRAVALILVGTDEAKALRQNWATWLGAEDSLGDIQVELLFDSNIDRPVLSLACDSQIIASVAAGVIFRMGKTIEAISEKLSMQLGDLADKTLSGKGTTTFGLTFSRDEREISFDSSKEHLVLINYKAETKGTFSAAYGPFRRFNGGDQTSESLFSTNPRLAAHLSIFSESVALTESLKWLKELKFKQLEQKPEGELLDRVIAFVNQEGFLPHHAQLTEISSDGVIFTDGEDSQVPVEELSDGYRSVLSMTFELIRQMARVFTPEQIFSSGDSSKVVAPGVILIDEVDAHLHPTWQRRIGLWFRKHFPNIQFIVTTHSPLVCQAAEHGSVWRLPKPGSGDKAEQVTGVELNRLLYGNVLDAYGTELFGEDVGRSDAGKELLQQLAVLNVKEVNQGLSKTEKKKQQELRATFPTSQPATNGQRKKGK